MALDSTLPGSLVSTTWLEEHLGGDLRVVDIRGYVKTRDLGGGLQASEYLGARDEYETGHIPGASFVDWTRDITDPNDPVPAQLAPPAQFAAAMEARGIGSESAIVIVDHTGGHFATRLWWALRYYGHANVALLDGGMNKWLAEGRAVSADTETFASAEFVPSAALESRKTVDDVAGVVHDGGAMIVDARDPATFAGDVWRGSRKGHIPGAINLPLKGLYNPDGTWKSSEELSSVVQEAGITPNTEVIAYCNGGVTATGVLFALHQTGHEARANYDGSWNEWGERLDLPTETGK